MKPSELKGLYEDYLRIADPTEYRFAVRCIGSWSQWEALLQEEPLKTDIVKWRRELEVKLRSEALQRIMDVAGNEGTRDSLQANRYLLEANYGNKDKAGRPSTKAIEQKAKELVAHNEQVKADFQRVFNNE